MKALDILSKCKGLDFERSTEFIKGLGFNLIQDLPFTKIWESTNNPEFYLVSVTKVSPLKNTCDIKFAFNE